MENYKHIFITGGSGFIGKNMQEQLAGTYALIAPSQAELDMLDEQAVQQFFVQNTIDVVIHAANIGLYRETGGPQETVAKNLRMFFNVERCLAKNQKMIFFGSGAEFDKRQNISGVREEDFDKRVPIDEYGFAKYVCSQYIMSTQKNIVNFRCFGVYGKYELQSRFISSAIADVLCNRPIIIRQNVFFDYLYVDDLVKMTAYFIENKTNDKIYNVVSGKRVDLITVAEIVKKVSGSKQNIVVENEGMGKEYTARNDRLVKEFSGISFTPLEEGISKLYEYYKSLQ